MSKNILVTVLVLLAIAYAVYFLTYGEGYCNCSGLGWKTQKPTFYVYRPTGDVSNYANDALSRGEQGQYVSIASEPMILPEVNLGWPTGMPYDSFYKSMTDHNSWAAGSDPNYQVNTSVPFVSLSELNGDASNVAFKNGGYAQNYGSSCGASFNNMTKIAPFAEGLKFVNGPSGYPNMLSDGTPQIQGPAGSFTAPANGCKKVCPTANAYNLGVGVL
jgi:hypothetical protein